MNHRPSSYLSLLFIILALLLSACSSKPTAIDKALTEQTANQRMVELEQLTQWKITGKIAFIEKESRNSASITWSMNEENQSQQLNLTSYLGINVLQLNSFNGEHTIEVDGKTYKGNNLEQLVNELTGLTLPAQALSYWLKGVPYLASDIITPQTTTNLPSTLLSEYNNETWQIDYSNYQQVNNYTLATKFTIKKNGLMIKIAINDWQVSAPNS